MTDNAKEVLALADELDDIETDGSGKCHWTEVATVSSALRRLSARQRASVEEVRDFILNHGDEWSHEGDAARALLAKYDIFEKVEG